MRQLDTIQALEGFLMGIALLASSYSDDVDFAFSILDVPRASSPHTTVGQAHKHLLRLPLQDFRESDLQILPGGYQDLSAHLENWFLKHTQRVPLQHIDHDKLGIAVSELLDGLTMHCGEDAAVAHYRIDPALYQQLRIPVIEEDRFLLFGPTSAAIIILSMHY